MVYVSRYGLDTLFKLKLIKERRKRITNPSRLKRTLQCGGAECDVCKKDYTQKDIQVDHIRDDVNRLNDVEDIQEFVEGLSLVTMADLRLVCKPCHSIISHSQRKGITFEEAKIEKERLLPYAKMINYYLTN